MKSDSLILQAVSWVLFMRNCSPLTFPWYQEPTDEEISRSFVVQPSACWAMHPRSDQVVRALFLGGTITATSQYSSLWQSMLRRDFTTDSYVLNAGMLDANPREFIGLKYDFEMLTPKMWPNIIILEFSTACTDAWACSRHIQALILSMRRKWASRKIQPPAFLLLEQFDADWIARYLGNNSTVPSRMGMMNQLEFASLAKNKSHFLYNMPVSTGAYFSSLARYYRFPLISTIDSTWPAFSRYIIRSKFQQYSWSTRMNSRFFIQRILHPFILEQMMTSNVCDQEEADLIDAVWSLPMLAEVGRNGLDLPIQWRARTNDAVHTLNKIFDESSSKDWRLVFHLQPSFLWLSLCLLPLRPLIYISSCSAARMSSSSHPRIHCIGSNAHKSTAVFKFSVPGLCANQGCNLTLGFIHQWDKGPLGSMNCRLAQLRVDISGKKHIYVAAGPYITIRQNSSNSIMNADLGALTEVTTYVNLAANLKGLENYRLDCTKTDKLWSCITGLAIIRQMQ